MKRAKDRLHRVVVIGATPAGIAATNKLGELGIPVTLVDNTVDLDEKFNNPEWRLKSKVALNFAHRPGLMRIMRNSAIRCVLPAKVTSLKHSHQGFRVGLVQEQTFVDPDRCILCGRCVDSCPVETPPSTDGEDDGRKAIRFNSRRTLPGRAWIDKRQTPLCSVNCPLGVNAQGYVALTRAGRFTEALALVRRDNILPGICGRICTHPCETACRRGELDGSVGIRNIKRFLADYETAHPELQQTPVVAEPRAEKIAVIGSGPAGLAAAAELAGQGCAVTIFEKEKQAGGLLRYGLGPHRLPRDILNAEIAYIESMGVEIRTGEAVDLHNLESFAEGYDVVLLTIGSWADRKLGVAGEDLDGVEGCIDFLNRVYRGEVKKLKEQVAIIGDGNAAYDLARTLVRLGAGVTIVSWFAADQIPADPEEVTAATEEGIQLKDQTQVTAFLGEDGKFTCLQCRTTRSGEPGPDGIAWPVIRKDSKPFELAFDRVFVAIGQTGGLAGESGQTPFDINPRGLIETNDTMQTNCKKLYAAGDAVSGASSVVAAMSQGREAARRILENVCGLEAFAPKTVRPQDRDFTAIPEDLPSVGPIHMPECRPDARCGNFDEVALGLSESQAMDEAGRCLQCGACSECLQCLEECDAIGAVRHDEPADHFFEHAGVLIIADPDQAPAGRGDDIIRAYGPASSRTDVYGMITRGFAAAARALVLLEQTTRQLKGHAMSAPLPDPGMGTDLKIGIFACRCNDSLGWLPEMDAFVADLASADDVVHAETVPSACVPEGTAAILKTAREKGLNRIVLASCVCCPLNFVCSACTDQRSRLKAALFDATGISRSMVVTANVRDEALSMLDQDPDLACMRFTGMIARAVRRARQLKPFSMPARHYNFTTAVIGETEAALESARVLADAGIDVMFFGSRNKPLKWACRHPNMICFQGSEVVNISGSIGDFQITARIDGAEQTFPAGAVIIGDKTRGRVDYLNQDQVPMHKVTCEMQKDNVTGVPFYYPGMTSIAGLFVAEPPGIQVSARQKGGAAAVLAAAVMPRGPRNSKGYTVEIDKDRCRICGRCLAVCPYRAISISPNGIGSWYAEVDAALCKGCGNCISVCPTGACDSPYRDQFFLEKTLEEILVD